MFNLSYEGVLYVNNSRAELLAVGVPTEEIGKALKAKAISDVEKFAESSRSEVATGAPGKLAEYQIKADIAADETLPELVALATLAGADPDATVSAELALVDRMAIAAGIDRSSYLALVAGKAIAYRQIALLIAALEAEAKAAIVQIPDDAENIETRLRAVLETAKEEAKTAFEEAQTLLGGK